MLRRISRQPFPGGRVPVGLLLGERAALGRLGVELLRPSAVSGAALDAVRGRSRRSGRPRRCSRSGPRGRRDRPGSAGPSVAGTAGSAARAGSGSLLVIAASVPGRRASRQGRELSRVGSCCSESEARKVGPPSSRRNHHERALTFWGPRAPFAPFGFADRRPCSAGSRRRAARPSPPGTSRRPTSSVTATTPSSVSRSPASTSPPTSPSRSSGTGSSSAASAATSRPARASARAATARSAAASRCRSTSRPEAVSASYDAGVLTVRVAGVHTEPESRRIAITGGRPSTRRGHPGLRGHSARGHTGPRPPRPRDPTA